MRIGRVWSGLNENSKSHGALFLLGMFMVFFLQHRRCLALTVPVQPLFPPLRELWALYSSLPTTFFASAGTMGSSQFPSNYYFRLHGHWGLSTVPVQLLFSPSRALGALNSSRAATFSAFTGTIGSSQFPSSYYFRLHGH